MTSRAHRHRLERLRARARDLDSASQVGVPVRPQEPIAQALLPLQRQVGPVGGLLTAGGVVAAVALGDARAGLLASVPGTLLVGLAVLGRDPRRRRVASVLATTVAGFLALASAPGLGGLAQGSSGAFYQAACCGLACLLLVVAWPAWRKANAVGDRARARRALYDEQSPI